MQCRVLCLRYEEAARAEVDPREPETLLALLGRRQTHGEQVVAAPRVERVVLGQGAGREYAHDRAIDEPLRLLGIARLLAHGDLVTLPEQPAHVAVGRLHRHAGHGDLALLVAGRERESERLRRELRVVVEHLVEVAHPEEHERIGVALLGGPVLGHGGRFGYHRGMSPDVRTVAEGTSREGRGGALHDAPKRFAVHSLWRAWGVPSAGSGRPRRRPERPGSAPRRTRPSWRSRR